MNFFLPLVITLTIFHGFASAEPNSVPGDLRPSTAKSNFSLDKDSQTLRVHVTNVRMSQGVLRVSLYLDPRGFPSNPSNAAQRIVSSVDTSSTTLTFEHLSSSSCAISVLHDINNNGRLDKNMLGIPIEPIAVSNNVPMRWGPPSFLSALISLPDNDNTITITLP